jgi:hypothetical protein
MTEFERVLQECLHDLDHGFSNVDDCLHRYPQHARQLEPILLTSTNLARAGTARPSNAFKARVRTKLIQQMRAHPRKPARSGFVFMRFAVGLAAVLLALLTAGTVYAQSALPGEAFYAWKLASESAWRAVSPDPVKTDLAIAGRRADELIAVRDDPALYAPVLEAYLEVAARLKSEVDAESETHILQMLDSQAEELNQSGILLPQPDSEVLPPSDEPTLAPATPLPILKTPQVNPTDLPQIVPTIQDAPEIVPTVEVPEEIIPTIQDPPELIPTIEIPPPIP